MAVWDSAKQSVDSPYSRPWLAELIFAFDARLRRRQAVVEYSTHPACIFRLEIARSCGQFTFRDGTRLQPGERIARLHFWTEHVPQMPQQGPTIPWARRLQKSISVSLRELARYLSSRPDLCDVRVICGDVPSGTKSQSGQVAHIMAYYGFEARGDNDRLALREHVRRFGENILISLTVFAQNPAALRLDTLMRVRVPIYLSRRNLECRFGSESAAAAAVEAS
jgi:hypothetical protein